ncbi:MAG TPA: HIT domain-containing protein [Acidobacteriaceae bacterium]|nr:HIT domain-containing protein [Acidobacteriaceae bacterium]
MDFLFTPWRYTYVSEVDKKKRQGIPEELGAWPGDTGCVFCNMIGAVDDAIEHGMHREEAERAAGILLRAPHNFVCLNRFPYTSGHIMVVPYEHESSLAAIDSAAAHEMMDLAQRAETILTGPYAPDGFNLGLNLGRSAGAGVAGHLHLHVLPRWTGDTNFLTTIGETRILPEDLSITWQRLRPAFAASAALDRTRPAR